MNINPAVNSPGSSTDVPVEDPSTPSGETTTLDTGQVVDAKTGEPIFDPNVTDIPSTNVTTDVTTDENGVVQIFPEDQSGENSDSLPSGTGIINGNVLSGEIPAGRDSKGNPTDGYVENTDPIVVTRPTSVPTDIDPEGNHTAKKEVNSTVEKKPIPIFSPVNGTLAGGPASTYTAMRNSGTRKHSGIDWQAKNGSVVKEMVGGTVLYNGNNSGYGANIVIKGDDNIIRRYATHGTTVNATVGSRIDQGQDVGTIAQGHLHYEEIPENLNGNRNSVYDEFISRPGQFVDTSNQRGTRDPLSSNNFSAGTLVQAGSPVGEGIVANVSPQDANQQTGGSNPVISDPLISAIPAQGIPSPAGAAKGVISSPTEGARVWVFFYGGDIQKPVYFASAISEYGQAYQA
jgi:hypothetical protein